MGDRWNAFRWTAAGTVVAQASALVRLLLVATVVPIAEIGVYAIAVSLTAAAGMFGNAGLRQLYLSRRADVLADNEDTLLSSTWVGIVAARILVLLVTGPAALLASTYLIPDTESLVSVAMVMAGTSVIAVIRNPELLAQERRGNFKPSVTSEAAGQIASLVLVLGAVNVWPSIWLLVAAQAVAAIVSAVLSYRVASVRRRVAATWGTLSRIFRMGRPFMVISVTTYATANLDKLLLGAMLSPSAAGIYFLAQRAADALRQLYATTVGRTVLPHYAEAFHQGGRDRLVLELNRYIAATLAAFAVTTAIITATAWLAPSIAGNKWVGAMAVLPILVVGVGFRAACHAASPGLTVTGYAGLDAQYKVQEALIYLVLLPSCIALRGVPGACVAFALIYVLSFARRMTAIRQLLPANERPGVAQ